MKREKYRNKIQNPVIWWLLIAFLVMTGIISIIACYFAYQQKRGELVSKLDMQLLQVTNEYKDLTEDFWAIYLPVFEVAEDNTILSHYFTEGSVQELSPMEKTQLAKVLAHMAVRDENVQWIAVYLPERENNYIYFPAEDNLQVLPKDFPYLASLSEKTKQMEVLPRAEIKVGQYQYQSIAIAGGTPGKKTEGSIIAGYNYSRLEQISTLDSGMQTLRFGIFQEGRTIFSSDKEGNWASQEYEYGQNGLYRADDKSWYVQVAEEKLHGEKICYAVLWQELLAKSNQSTLTIIIITLGMAFLAVAVYILMLHSFTREVKVIQDGLDILGGNRLDFRIENRFHQPELVVIADAINQMAQSLQENIERTHEYEQRQIKSELQELQAKFNPHFLYNTLEIFRARCYQNGDEETADLIAQTAAIFRGFIGSRTFIPMQEELAFSKRYLALFKARFGEAVKVLYDIDTEVLQYGIIRNVFQPLIENYFEHGYHPGNKENYILFRGRIRDEETILLSVEDNGTGMKEEALRELNAQLQQPISSGKECYGLRNLHQRLRLFYGGECGITLKARENTGLIIEMIIKRQQCEDNINS